MKKANQLTGQALEANERPRVALDNHPAGISFAVFAEEFRAFPSLRRDTCRIDRPKLPQRGGFARLGSEKV
jgi:hypothetical protein